MGEELLQPLLQRRTMEDVDAAVGLDGYYSSAKATLTARGRGIGIYVDDDYGEGGRRRSRRRRRRILRSFCVVIGHPDCGDCA